MGLHTVSMLPEVLTISAWPPYSASHSSYSAFSLATGVSPSMMYAPPSHGSWNVSSRNSSKVRSSLRVAVVSPTMQAASGVAAMNPSAMSERFMFPILRAADVLHVRCQHDARAADAARLRRVSAARSARPTSAQRDAACAAAR